MCCHAVDKRALRLTWKGEFGEALCVSPKSLCLVVGPESRVRFFPIDLFFSFRLLDVCLYRPLFTVSEKRVIAYRQGLDFLPRACNHGPAHCVLIPLELRIKQAN
jgi:hypothetical protein